VDRVSEGDAVLCAEEDVETVGRRVLCFDWRAVKVEGRASACHSSTDWQRTKEGRRTGKVALLGWHPLPADGSECQTADVESGVVELGQKHLAAERVVAVDIQVHGVPLLVPAEDEVDAELSAVRAV
jgi:hypothetical protein